MQWAIIIGLGVLGFVGALVLLVRRAERARTEALQQASLGLGLSFAAEGDLEQIKAVADLPLFGHGHSRHVTNVMIGRTGSADVTVFDYQYTTGGGKESHTWRQTVVLYPGGARGLPDFVLAPENVFHKLGQMFGYQDIDFDSSPLFSARYLLRGPDEAAIRSAFTDEVRGFLEQEQGWTVEVRAGSVGIYRAGKRVKPEELFSRLEQSRAVLRALGER